MGDSSMFPPHVVPCGTPDAEYEAVFPEGFEGSGARSGGGPGIGNSEEAERLGYQDRHVVDVRAPRMYCYPAPADANTGAAVVICPGGAYALLAADKEGHDIARFFNGIGVSAFVLYYPMPRMNGVPGEFPFLPLRSLQRSLRLVRSRAGRLGIDPERVGVAGFSAGAHLAAMASTLWRDEDEQDASLRRFSPRPSFSVLVYPVITMSTDKRNVASTVNLIGENPDRKTMERFSPDLQVDAETPPAFLVHAEDDCVPVENSIMYFLALKNAGVPAEMHLYPEGGHGYGMRRRRMAVDSWPDRLRDWMRRFF